MEKAFIPRRKNESEGEIRTPEEEKSFAETELALDKTDFDTLRAIFNEERVRSGAPVEESRFVTRDRVKVTKQTVGAAEYLKNERSIAINPTVMHRLFSQGNFEQSPDSGGNLENQVRSTLVHEETHASARNKDNQHPALEFAYTFLLSRIAGPKVFGASGYGYTEARDGRHENVKFILFNEAVTDLLAEEVYKEYQTRTGTTSLGEYRPAYLIPRALLESFLLHTAETAGIPRDTVWNSIKRGYFEGLNLDDTELAAGFDELALTEVIAGMRKISDQREIPALIQNLSMDKSSEESRKRIGDGMKVVQNVTGPEVRLADENPEEWLYTDRAKVSRPALTLAQEIEQRMQSEH